MLTSPHSSTPTPFTGQRPAVDLSVYLVTDTAQCGGPDEVVRTVAEAVAAGATLVQFRDKDLPDAEFVALGQRIAEVLRGTNIPLLVNDRVGLVSAIGAQGAHIGQSDLGIQQAREMLGPGAILGLSAQTPAHIRQAAAAGLSTIDYLGVGALHSTETKPEAGDLGLQRLAAAVQISPWPVCAIGGVKPADAASLARIGCAGMSVVSAICGQPDVGVATRALVDAWQAATNGPAHTQHKQKVIG